MNLEASFCIPTSTLATGELFKWGGTGEAIGTHSGHVNRQTKAMLKDGNLNACKRRSRDYLDVVDVFLLADANDSSKLRLLEPLQMFDIPKIHGPCLKKVERTTAGRL